MRALVVGLGILGLLLVVLGVAWADGGGGLEEATKLREGSGIDWNAGEYAAAAEKLKRAAEIYSALPGDHSRDLGTVFRARVWNLTKTESYAEALQVLQKLMDLAKNVPAIEGELASGNAAFYEVAKSKRSLDDQLAILRPVREAALERDSETLAAQVLHDMASMTRDAGNLPGAVDLYEEAIAERHRIGDLVGKAWSLNNFANVYLLLESPGDAMGALLEAYRLVHEDEILAPQASLAVNLRDALGQFETHPSVGIETSKWIWRLAETGARSSVPEVIPSDYLLRTAAAMTARLPDKRSAWEAAKRLRKVKAAEGPVEIQAHQLLAAARMALDAGKASDAAAWLKKVDVGEGPCGLHLKAQVHTLRAVAAAIRKKKSTFDEEATQAMAAWASAGDSAAQLDALKKLAPLGTKIEAKSAPELQAALTDVKGRGKAGGLGGAASGGGDRSGFANLGLHDPLFEVGMIDGKIVIRDVCADHKTAVAVTWQPRSVGLNGLSLTVFGGWVRVDGLAYGGGASASGQPGSTTTEALGAVCPIPGKGRLVILKNGAVTYTDD